MSRTESSDVIGAAPRFARIHSHLKSGRSPVRSRPWPPSIFAGHGLFYWTMVPIFLLHRGFHGAIWGQIWHPSKRNSGRIPCGTSFCGGQVNCGRSQHSDWTTVRRRAWRLIAPEHTAALSWFSSLYLGLLTSSEGLCPWEGALQLAGVTQAELPHCGCEAWSHARPSSRRQFRLGHPLSRMEGMQRSGVKPSTLSSRPAFGTCQLTGDTRCRAR